jgi:hypothetical protein
MATHPHNATGEFAVAGDRLYTASDVGMSVLGIGDAARPVLLGTFFFDGGNGVTGTSLRVAGDHAFLATGRGGLTVVDVAEPRNPVQAGQLAVGMWAQRLSVRDGRAYVSVWDREYTLAPDVAVVDLADPPAPRLLGRHRTRFVSPGLAEQLLEPDVPIEIVGDALYVGAPGGGISVLQTLAGSQIYLPYASRGAP